MKSGPRVATEGAELQFPLPAQTPWIPQPMPSQLGVDKLQTVFRKTCTGMGVGSDSPGAAAANRRCTMTLPVPRQVLLRRNCAPEARRDGGSNMVMDVLVESEAFEGTGRGDGAEIETDGSRFVSMDTASAATSRLPSTREAPAPA